MTKEEAMESKNSPFMNFRLDVMNADVGLRNEIYYKGSLIHKFEAFLKFGSYEKMIANRNIKIVTKENVFIS